MGLGAIYSSRNRSFITLDVRQTYCNEAVLVAGKLWSASVILSVITAATRYRPTVDQSFDARRRKMRLVGDPTNWHYKKTSKCKKSKHIHIKT